MTVPPLLILALGMATVIGMILVLRLNAFLSLITAALVVSVLSPGLLAEKVSRVAAAFGSTAGSIGIVIALAAVIGMSMLESRAADRVVKWFLSLFGVKRADVALMSSGFILSVPVFFDTVFYLLIPLARSMFRQTGRSYAKYITVIAGGAIVTHSLVPPTPGPLINAQNLGVDLGTMIVIGLLVAIPASVVALIVASWIDSRLNIPMRGHDEIPKSGTSIETSTDADLPGLGVSLLPIILPVSLITANTVAQATMNDGPITQWTAFLGDPNFAMLAAATAAVLLYVVRRKPGTRDFAIQIERALMGGGLIILITSAGGAFGAMLQTAEVGPAIQGLFGASAASGVTLLFASFLMASLLKIAQGSSTVSMITTSAMLGAMIIPESLAYHPVYVATAIGSGSMVGSWMNDSGFWVVSKMGGLTETETFRTWSTITATVGITSFVVTLILAVVLPLR